MRETAILPRNPFFEVLGDLNAENRSDHKVAMLTEVNMTSCMRLRDLYKVTGPLKPSYTALLAKAVALALRDHPHANRFPLEWPFWRRLVAFRDVHVSVAVERDQPGIEQAVYVGTLRDTDSADLPSLTNGLRELARATPETCPRWRAMHGLVNRLPAFLARWIISLPRWFPRLWVEHRGGAALISSPGKYGFDALVGAWPWPLGFSFGVVKERPWVENGALVVRPTMTVSMSFDRRLMGGAPAARFFQDVCRRLEHAERDLNQDQDRCLKTEEPASTEIEPSPRTAVRV